MGRGHGMLDKLWLVFDLALVTVMLFFATLSYGAGNLWFIEYVSLILALSAARIVRWQINRILRKSVQNFEKSYQEYLETMGYKGNGEVR